MPTFRHGKKTAVFINGTDMSPFLNEATTTQAIETAETTTFGSDDKTYMTGLSDGTISSSGLFDSTAGASDAVLSGMIATEDNAVTVFPEGNVLGRRAVIANGQLTSYEVSSPVADVISISAEVQADGGLYHGIALTGSVSASATANQVSTDNTAATSNGLIANVHVTANTRDGASTIKIQHSVDDSTFVDLITFSSVSASATVGENLTTNGTVNRYLRAQQTLAGTTGTITFNIASARR